MKIHITSSSLHWQLVPTAMHVTQCKYLEYPAEGRDLCCMDREVPGAELEDLASEEWAGLTVVDLEGGISMKILVSSLPSAAGFELS